MLCTPELPGQKGRQGVGPAVGTGRDTSERAKNPLPQHREEQGRAEAGGAALASPAPVLALFALLLPWAQLCCDQIPSLAMTSSAKFAHKNCKVLDRRGCMTLFLHNTELHHNLALLCSSELFPAWIYSLFLIFSLLLHSHRHSQVCGMEQAWPFPEG